MTASTKPLRAAVLGATGIAGQQFLVALARHPQIRITRLGASSRSAGKTYQEAITGPDGRSSWFARGELTADLAALPVEDASLMSTDGLDLVFSAVESDAARALEERFAADVPVLSTASAFRYEADVPVLLPGVNFDHARLIEVQRRKRGWRGFVAPGPNCTTVGLCIALAPLVKFGIERVVMTSMQSVSGAGRSPGVIALDIVDNVIPYIAKEEEKVERETRKILGHLGDDGLITAADIAVSCTCTRVPVLEGHTEAVFVGLRDRPPLTEVRAALDGFGRDLHALGLPSLPERLIWVTDDPYRPQPRLDRDNAGGMATTVGRLREEPVLGGVKFVLVSHNTQMGAAHGSVLIAEYLVKQGYIE